MKKHILIVIFLLSALFSACKKDKESTATTEPDQQVSTQVTDNSELKSQDDELNTEMREAVEKNVTISGGRLAVDDTTKIVCGCVADYSQIANKVITFTFDGTTQCGTNPRRVRSGTIKVELVKGERWSQPNSVLGFTFTNFKVVRSSDDKSWTYNGFKTLTNLFGSTIADRLGFLAGTDSLAWKERGNDIKVDIKEAGQTTGVQVSYSLSRITTWKKMMKAGQLRSFFKAFSDTTINGIPFTDTWGTNRFGNTFTNSYTRPIISDEYCNFWAPNSGEFVHKSNGNTVTVTYGVTKSGDLSTVQCAYGWKLNWLLSNGVTGSKIYSY